jgi:hypothetical protein
VVIRWALARILGNGEADAAALMLRHLQPSEPHMRGQQHTCSEQSGPWGAHPAAGCRSSLGGS